MIALRSKSAATKRGSPAPVRRSKTALERCERFAWDDLDRGLHGNTSDLLHLRRMRAIELVSHLRRLEAALLELNKIVATDEALALDGQSTRSWRNGIVTQDVFANLARYQAYLVREMDAVTQLEKRAKTALGRDGSRWRQR